MTVRACPVCDHDRATVIHSQTFVVPDDQGSLDRHDVVCCDRCGVGFADTATSQAQYDAIYADRSGYAAGPAAQIPDSARDLQRFRDVAAAIERVVGDRRARVVDIGCAARAPGVIVWGAGELTAKLLADTELARANVVGFVDSNPDNQGRTLKGPRIEAPDALRSGDEVIVVPSILHAAGIKTAIRAQELANPVVTLMADGSPSASPEASW